MDAPYAQRWHNGREVKRTPDERINLREYGVEEIEERVAKPFVCRHHYSGSYPAGHVAYGLYRKAGVSPSRLVGVAVFSEGVQSGQGMPRWTGFTAAEGTELGRLVCTDEVLYNGESVFVARAFDMLRSVRRTDPVTGAEAARFRVVLSASDPMPRWSPAGRITKGGHFGCVYQALNALHVGTTERRTLHVGSSGRVIHPYNFDKVRTGRRGAAAAERNIVAAGAAPRRADENPAEWVARVKATLPSFRHPGNFLYVWGLDHDSRKALARIHGKGRKYPKKDEIDAHLAAALRQVPRILQNDLFYTA